MTGIYYEAPAQPLFDEMKTACTAQWNTHDNTYGYVDEKVARIKDIGNVKDNFMYMLAMFDEYGMRAIIDNASDEMREAIRVRMVDGGNEDWFMRRIGL